MGVCKSGKQKREKMKTTISWIMAGFSIWGMVLNIQKKKSCFIWNNK